MYETGSTIQTPLLRFSAPMVSPPVAQVLSVTKTLRAGTSNLGVAIPFQLLMHLL